jgi:hypothetical protein
MGRRSIGTREGRPPCALCGAPAAAYFVLLIESARPIGREPLCWEASAACFRCDTGR